MTRTYTTPAGMINNVYDDMLNQHNLLIGGMIGSGKTTIINGLIYTALYRTPGKAQFILIDPKRVSLRKYAELPHTIRYAREHSEMIEALEYAEKIMMQRYDKADREGLEEWTADGDLYIFVDEFADLMLKEKKRVEPVLQSIGQLGRAAHVHLILATQIPNRQVITAKIKANMSSSIALHCREAIESRQVIGHSGAEFLPQFGDCIYQTPQKETHYTNVTRYSDNDIADRIDWWMQQKPTKPTRRGLFGWTRA